MTIYPKLIHDALATVRYPGNGKSIMENEMLEDDLRIDGMKVSFSLIFEKETDPFKKDADFDDSFSKEKDDYASGIFSSSESKDPDKESDDDLFSSHVTVDDEDQFISN